MTNLAAIALVLVLAPITQTLGFSTTPIPQISIRTLPELRARTTITLKSAKVVPFAYAGATAALLHRATRAATSNIEKAVLLSTAALSLFNLGPTDNARLSSAKRAERIYQSCTPPSKYRKSALKWRALVRMKLIGQLIGLIYMAVANSSANIMRGGAIVMATNMLFFLGGAGPCMHDKDGIADPMPTSKSRGLLAIDTVLTVAALAAASSPLDSTRYAASAGVFAVGAAIGGLEGLAVLVAKKEKI